MNAVKDFIGQDGNWWMPVVVFAVIFLIAGLIGAWNGWKTALYFLGWNVVALIPSVILLDEIVKTISTVDFGELSKMMNLHYLILHFGGLIILFSILLVTNFLAFLFYWIFRKKLKRTIKENKEQGISNAATRWIGAGVGVVVAAPMAVFLTETASLASSDNGFTEFNGYLTKAFTGGKVEPYEQADKDDIGRVLDVVGDIGSVVQNISDIFKGGADATNIDAIVTDPTKKTQVENILNNRVALEAINPDGIKDKLPDGVDLTTVQPADIHAPSDASHKFTISSENKPLLQKLMTALGMQSATISAIFSNMFKTVA